MFYLKHLKGLIFWAIFAATLWAFYLLRVADVNAVIAVLGVTIGNIIVVAIVETLVPFRPDWSWWNDRQAPNDLIHGLLLSVAGPRLGEALLGASLIGAAAFIADNTTGGLWPHALPIWVQLILAIIIADFFEWGKHWAYHRLPGAWWLHALHHDIDRLHVLKGARLHFLEATVRYGVTTMPLIILGADADLLLWYAVLVNALGNLNHSNIDLPLPGFMHYLFQTPQNHRLHHERDPDLGRSNLSSVTMLPDLLFGTFRHPNRHPLNDVGIHDSPIPGNLVGQLIAPLAWPLLARNHKRKIATAKSVVGTALTLVLLASVIPTGLYSADAQQTPHNGSNIEGEWATQGFGSKVLIGPCKDRAPEICGEITWLWEPVDVDGNVILDTKNPDAALKQRPLIGINILEGFTYSAKHNEWRDGRIYNPEDGRRYRATIRRKNDTTLQVKGCAVRVFCQTQIWRLASTVTPDGGGADAIGTDN
jgi:sterol desaturase/sphingolipid hydroxylase (fatty acid hydroxylase superfamily)/uncharacterized protein (DUF2147 family)